MTNRSTVSFDQVTALLVVEKYSGEGSVQEKAKEILDSLSCDTSEKLSEHNHITIFYMKHGEDGADVTEENLKDSIKRVFEI